MPPREIEVKQKLRELKDELIDAMERLENMEVDQEKPLKKRINIPLPNIDPDVCPVCHQKGSLQTKTIQGRNKVYEYPAFAHYVGTEGTTTRIRWCYLKRSKKK